MGTAAKAMAFFLPIPCESVFWTGLLIELHSPDSPYPNGSISLLCIPVRHSLCQWCFRLGELSAIKRNEWMGIKEPARGLVGSRKHW